MAKLECYIRTLQEHLHMSHFATKESQIRVAVWVVWFLVILAALVQSSTGMPTAPTSPLLGVVVHDAAQSGALFPWLSTSRWKKWALHQYRTWRSTYQRAKRTAQMARLAMQGVLTMAQVVDWLTASQMRYQLGALPVLYAVLETLQVRRIINRHCPGACDVDYGAVAIVLVLNRLMLPLPLYQIADWVGQTVLVSVLGIPTSKFNDDRLGRTLDVLYPHLNAIWGDIVAVALQKTGVDLSVVFYDVTAFVTHGQHPESQLVDFGFAHNTPSNKRKLKLALNAAADGNIPLLYQTWSGRTADQATVETNLNNLAAWLHKRGKPLHESLIVGDRAMLNAELALLYDKFGLRHLTGLKATSPQLKAVIGRWSDAQIECHPLVEGPSPQYWGRTCDIPFVHEDQCTTHKGLVVVAGPLRDQWRQARKAQLQALEFSLEQLSREIGQPRLRSVKAVQRRVNAKMRNSAVKQFLIVTVNTTLTGEVKLSWQCQQAALTEAERLDGRYLLVTNDWSLSPQEMFRLYRQKDGVEKCFRLCKNDLHVSPLYLHQDQRISAMLFLNMVALLVYTVLQRQMQQQGVQLTTRRLIQRLEPLTIIETICWDGSSLRRLTPDDPDLLALLEQVAGTLDDLLQAAIPAHQPKTLPGTTASSAVHLLPDPMRC